MRSPAPAEPVSRRRFLDSLTREAELLAERTFRQVGPPLWVERINLPPDFDVSSDFGFARIGQPNLVGTLLNFSAQIWEHWRALTANIAKPILVLLKRAKKWRKSASESASE